MSEPSDVVKLILDTGDQNGWFANQNPSDEKDEYFDALKECFKANPQSSC